MVWDFAIFDVYYHVGLEYMKRLTPILACLILAGCSGCLGPKVQRPHSDVPVVHRIGWWAYQDGLSITNFSVEVVDAPLCLFNSKALVRMSIAGTVRYEKGGWRPSIRKVHIGERFDTANTNTVPIADFLVTPVIDVKQDKRYTGEPIPFELKVENHFQTFGWGQNPYRIVCGSFTNETVLMQMK